MEKYSRIKALISLDAIRYNFEQMKKNIKEGTKIIAVIKADAYGHGAVPIAAMLENLDYIWGFATATAQEALQLRREGITRPILILGLVFEEYYEELAREDVRMAVCDYETARKFSEAAASCGKKALIHLAADTGMTRIGFKDSEESLEEIRRIYELDNVEVEGLFTHFARADEYDRTPAMVQLKRYLDFADLLEKNGIINRILGLVGLGPFEMINTSGAVVLGMVYNYLPYMILPLYTAMTKIDQSVVEAAQDLGAGMGKILTRVLIPLSVPGIATGITMVFVPAVSTFIISRMLGGGSNLLIGDLIELQFLGNSYNYNLGSAMSLVLMVIVLLCMSFTSSFDEEDMEGVV